MYSTKRNILQLTSVMLRSGIHDVVVCPGSRNAPLVHTFKAAGMNCYEITDERSAGFFALGVIEAKSVPVAVCCTSGSAVLNLSPAVAEAYYRPLPLLVVTADRPGRWIGQMDGQTLPQTEAFGSLVRKSVSLPEPSWDEQDEMNEEEAWHCNRLVNEAIIAMRKYRGPAHINVPITEPLFDFSMTELPEERVIDYRPDAGRKFDVSTLTAMKAELNAAERVMLVVGQMSASEADEVRMGLKRLAEKGCVVIAERLSNLRLEEGVVDNFDEILFVHSGKPELVPDMVVTIGGHIVSKRIKRLLRNSRPKYHWHIDRNGELADLFRCATRLVEAPAKEVIGLMEENILHSDEYKEQWMRCSAQAERRSDTFDYGSFTDMGVMRRLLPAIGSHWRICVGNSSVVRNMQLFRGNRNTVLCNRGVNGIEGSVSAAVGNMAAGIPVVLLIGDLSLFYDRNGLWNNFVCGKKSKNAGCAPIRIVVFNNGGGQIFRHLPGLSESPYMHRYIAAGHSTTAEGMAMEISAKYMSVRNYEELERAAEEMFRCEERVVIMEIFTSPDENERCYKMFYEWLKYSGD